MPDHSAIATRCKSYELPEAHRAAMRGLPLLARLDGRAFHTLTRRMERPFDAALHAVMVETAKALVAEFHARIGYTQSDEITLLWYEPADSASEYPFGGRFQKLCSVLASYAAATFVEEMPAGRLSATATPAFDCRVWQVPDKHSALEVFVWREDEAVKNSISSAAQAQFSHRELQGKHSGEMQEMLHALRGINWNDYPAAQKRGTYVQRQTMERTLTEEERARIPEAHRPPPEKTFTRGFVATLDVPPIRRHTGAMAMLFAEAT